MYFSHSPHRASSEKGTLVESTVNLPTLTVEHQPLYVECSLPAYGHVHKPLDVCYTLHNRTGYVQEFEASMDTCDMFVFSGHKQVRYLIGHVNNGISFL